MFAQWSIFRGPTPGGETIDEVVARARRIVERVDAADGAVLCFGHGTLLAVLAAVALDLDPLAAQRLVLDPTTISVVGSEHDQRALHRWNAPPY